MKKQSEKLLEVLDGVDAQRSLLYGDVRNKDGEYCYHYRYLTEYEIDGIKMFFKKGDFALVGRYGHVTGRPVLEIFMEDNNDVWNIRMREGNFVPKDAEEDWWCVDGKRFSGYNKELRLKELERFGEWNGSLLLT